MKRTRPGRTAKTAAQVRMVVQKADASRTPKALADSPGEDAPGKAAPRATAALRDPRLSDEPKSAADARAQAGAIAVEQDKDRAVNSKPEASGGDHVGKDEQAHSGSPRGEDAAAGSCAEGESDSRVPAAGPVVKPGSMSGAVVKPGSMSVPALWFLRLRAPSLLAPRTRVPWSDAAHDVLPMTCQRTSPVEPAALFVQVGIPSSASCPFFHCGLCVAAGVSWRTVGCESVGCASVGCASAGASVDASLSYLYAPVSASVPVATPVSVSCLCLFICVSAWRGLLLCTCAPMSSCAASPHWSRVRLRRCIDSVWGHACVVLRYVTKENETPRSIAKRMGMALDTFLKVALSCLCQI